MRLRVLLPSKIFLDEEVKKIIAEDENGSFCLLPRHVDVVTALVPGLLSYHDAQGNELFVAVDEGILVKCGPEVLVSTRRAVLGPDLGTLRKMIEEEFRTVSEREKLARSASAKLEAGLVRRFVELEKRGA